MARPLHPAASMQRNTLVLLGTLALAACAAGDDTTDASQEVAGTPDELALLRMLNDRTTEVSTLDVQAALDSRAARNLIAHRDGPDGLSGSLDDNLFDSAAEVDAVPYVGPSAMDKLVDFATSGGWVHDDEVFGTFDGVVFDVAEARAAVDFVDTASFATLHDSVKLDSRTTNNIIAARPIPTMAALAAVPYVGPSAMTKIHAAVGAPTSCSDDAFATQVSTAIAGMWLTSESDYPVERVWYPGKGASGGSAAQLLALLGLPASTPVHVNTVDWLMTRLGYSNDPAAVDALRALLRGGLRDIVVYEVGTIQVHDYLVGVTACGGLVGITSISIET